MNLSTRLYSAIIRLYILIVRVVSLWNNKARQWINGRKDLFVSLQRSIQPEDRMIWVHCASAGEFEQGKPIIEELKRSYPAHKILVSFFSPSGYHTALRYTSADIITYLPADTPANARRFVELVDPELVIFIKYEFWYHHLHMVKEKGIPLLLSSAVFREDQIFFKWYGRFFRNMLSLFQMIFVQDEASLRLLQQHQFSNCTIGGDTRFDRVLAIASNFSEVPKIQSFISSKAVIVAGSTWPDDEKLLAQYAAAHADLLIIAPHEIDANHLEQLDRQFPGSRRYSKFVEGDNCQVLIIDNIGMLSKLYRYGTVTYVGGGFTRDGIHNILEAAVYGKPVIIGPNYEKYREAIELIRAGGAFSITDAPSLEKQLSVWIHNKEVRESAGQASSAFIKDNRGATGKVISYIQENLLLTS